MQLIEKIALATSAKNLSWSDHKQTSIELVAALAATSSLASDMLRAAQSDSQAMRRAIRALAEKSIKAGHRKRINLSHELALTLSVCAMIEHLQPNCRKCKGAKVLMLDKLKIICHECGGVGVHRYTDSERSLLCNVSDWRKVEKKYNLIQTTLRTFNDASSAVRQRLG